mgnify:CR=1 FL=1
MERDALEWLYETYYRQVYLYALSLCRNGTQAEELTSDTFYRALLSVGETKEHMKYWLLRVCKNCWYDWLRKQKRQSDAPFPQVAVPEEALSMVLQKEENRRLYQGILSLPPRYQELLYLFYFAEYSVMDIATLRKETPGAVKTALSRARVALKKKMEEGKE